MKSRLLLLAVLLVIICASCQPKKKTEPEKEAITGATYTNPLRERGAEPWAVFIKGNIIIRKALKAESCSGRPVILQI